MYEASYVGRMRRQRGAPFATISSAAIALALVALSSAQSHQRRGHGQWGWSGGSEGENEPDPHTVLGVRRGASTQEVKAAWKKYARQHHPDRDGGDEDAFIRGSRAYEQLTSPQGGGQYQQHHQNHHHYGHQHHYHQDPFQQWFEHAQRAHQQRSAYLSAFSPSDFASQRQLAELKSGVDPRPTLLVFMHVGAHLTKGIWDELTHGLASAGVVCAVVDAGRSGGAASFDDHHVREPGLRGYYRGRVLTGPSLNQPWLKLGHLQRFVLEWLSGGIVLGGWVGGWGSATGLAAATFGVPLWHTVKVLHTQSDAEHWIHQSVPQTAAVHQRRRVLLLVEDRPSELPRHAAVLTAADRYPNAADFALMAVSSRESGAVRVAHEVRHLPAVVVYTADDARAHATRSAVAEGGSVARQLDSLLAVLEREAVASAAPSSLTERLSKSVGSWVARTGAWTASWASWSWAAAMRYGELSVLLGMFVVATLFLQLDAIFNVGNAAPQGAPVRGVGANPSDNKSGATNAGHGDDDLLGGDWQHNDRKLLFGLREKWIPTLKASELHREIHPATIDNLAKRSLSSPSPSSSTVDPEGSSVPAPPRTIVILLRNLKKCGGDDTAHSTPITTASTSANTIRQRRLDTGVGEVGIGDVVCVLTGRKLSRLGMYRFAWLDAQAAHAWVDARVGHLLAARSDDLKQASFAALVVSGRRAALYVAPPPIVPGVSDLKDRTQQEAADTIRMHRDGLIMFLERLGDGTERWMRLHESSQDERARQE